MPYRQSLKRYTARPWEDFVGAFQDRDAGLMEAVVAGCAIVAYADGWVTQEERKRMLNHLRGFEPIARFGVDDVTGWFEEVTGWFEEDHDGGEQRALEIVARLRGRAPYPELLVQTCCAIADADGGFDAEERKAAARICETLELEPGRFDLADAR